VCPCVIERERMRGTGQRLFNVGMASLRYGASTRKQHIRQVKGLPYLLSQVSLPLSLSL
jgi:hypothetical protein